MLHISCKIVSSFSCQSQSSILLLYLSRNENSFEALYVDTVDNIIDHGPLNNLAIQLRPALQLLIGRISHSAINI